MQPVHFGHLCLSVCASLSVSLCLCLSPPPPPLSLSLYVCIHATVYALLAGSRAEAMWSKRCTRCVIGVPGVQSCVPPRVGAVTGHGFLTQSFVTGLGQGFHACRCGTVFPSGSGVAQIPSMHHAKRRYVPNRIIFKVVSLCFSPPPLLLSPPPPPAPFTPNVATRAAEH